MNQMQFQIPIHAPKEKVWATMWDDTTFRQWAGIIDTGTYMVGELTEGAEIQFISAENGYGVTSLVESVTPNEYLLLKHKADTQNTGAQNRADQWTGGEEKYTLVQSADSTTLTAIFDVPTELEGYFNDTYPKAFACIKELSERT